MNYIGDAGAASLATVLRLASCGLRRLDLTCNQMSMEGVRVLAKALEENCSRGVSHVYVHSEGRIDALGRKKEDKRQSVKERNSMMLWDCSSAWLLWTQETTTLSKPATPTRRYPCHVEGRGRSVTSLRPGGS
ncbi:unnamed protein product [Ectocarpus sp. 12 AP-2014]